jgi:multidomain signaling protein FimX
MPQPPVPLIVYAAGQDYAELINRVLRGGGHPVRCHWIDVLDGLADALERIEPQMLIFFPKGLPVRIPDVVKIRQRASPMVPLLVVTEEAAEAEIARAMREGARDLVSFRETQRLVAVIERELRTFRLEQALNEVLLSASQYKKQLKAVMADAMQAIAYVKEGIVVEANQAWAELFGHAAPDAAQGPLMDLFETASQAAVKGALVASARGQWDHDVLRVTAIGSDGGSIPLKLALEACEFEGEAAVRLSIPREEPLSAEPEQLIDNAVHRDPVTGFYHRRRFVELLTDELEQHARSGVRALAYIRPDKFNDIKNEVGTLASEEILIQLADVLRALVHEKDLCGRFGGTVFTILLERGTLRDIEAWAENATRTIADHMFEVAHNTLSLTCTIGLAEVGPATDLVEGLLSGAEKACERGRQRGGNRVVLEETSDESTRVQRVDELWIKQIKAALLENRFRLAHLPIVSLLGEQHTFYDTLIRMIDDRGDEVLATEFMPAASRNKLLKTIDRWVIGASIDFCRAKKPDRVFVKLSRDSIIDPTLTDWLDKQTTSAGVRANTICFQVTEDDATQYLKQTRTLSEQLKSRGFVFAVEHFGIGRDPIRVLEQVPMQYLKIDGSLMQSLATNQVLQERVRGFVQAARKHKIETIAERVEDANTMAVLFQLGATHMQGHYVQEPDVVLEDSDTKRISLAEL